MSRSEKRTPGTVVSPMEMNEMVRSLQDIYIHLGTNARHLHTIEAKAERLKAQIEALLPAPEPEPEEAPVEVYDGLKVFMEEVAKKDAEENVPVVEETPLEAEEEADEPPAEEPE